MSVSVSPHTRFAAALIAAGVVSAASVVSLPAPTTRIDVANASAVTDALSSFGKGVEVLSSLVGIHADAVVSLPFEASLAVLAAQQHPELGSSVLSYLVQRFVNPAVGAPIYAYPWETEQAVSLLASLLPHPLGPSATDPGLLLAGGKAFAAAFDGVLGQLGDPLPGFGAVQDVMNGTVLGGVVVAGQLAVRAPIYLAWNTVNYLGNLPVDVEASIESAISDPRQIPGLISHLVYGLLSPDANTGLLGKLLNNAIDPLTWLPAPIGFGSTAAVGLANEVRAAITNLVNGALAALPTPVTPSALPASTPGQGQPIYSVGAGKGATTPDALPSASLAGTNLVTLSAVSEEAVSSTAAAKRSTVESKDAFSQLDSAVPTGDGVEPAETKPAETKPAEAKPIVTKPAETKPVDVKPAEDVTNESAPAKADSGETKPDEAKPGKTKPGKAKSSTPKSSTPKSTAKASKPTHAAAESTSAASTDAA